MKNTLKNTLEKKINIRLFYPALFAVIVYLLSYQIPKVIDTGPYHYVSLPIDDMIPMLSIFSPIYLVSFIQWIYALYHVIKHDTKFGYYFLDAIIIGSLIGFVIFLVYPTATLRQPIEGNSIFDWMLRYIHSADSIKNGFPSFHCFCSTLSCFMLKSSPGIRKSILSFNVIYTILVYASTLFTKQHYFLDIPGGIVLAFLSLLLAKKISFASLYERINHIFLIKHL